MSWHESGPARDRYHAALDEATVIRLECTSSVAVINRVDREVEVGIPAYDHAPYTEPRDELARCAWGPCGRTFWRHPTGEVQRYCSVACQQAAARARSRLLRAAARREVA